MWGLIQPLYDRIVKFINRDDIIMWKKNKKLLFILTIIVASILTPNLVFSLPRHQEELKNLKTSQQSFETYWGPNGLLLFQDIEHTGTHTDIFQNENGNWFIGLGEYDIFLQKVNSDGIIQWMEGGVPVCTAINEQVWPQICSDGNGGVIMVWEDWREGNGDIYAQRVDSSGTILWDNNGIVINNASGIQGDPLLCPDGSDNFIIAWDDSIGIYVQKIDSDGNLLWGINGKLVCSSVAFGPEMISDGAGGVIMTWEDNRGENYDIYAQRIDSNGNFLWDLDGVAICTESDDQLGIHICSDGASGAIISWAWNWSLPFGYYTQRVDSNGNTLWTPNGTKIATLYVDYPWAFIGSEICSDGIGGAIITWSDNKTDDWDIFAQRIDADGNLQWGEEGIIICNATNDQDYIRICSDGIGGALIMWTDMRTGTIYESSKIYIQRINAEGDLLYLENGVRLCMTEGVIQLGLGIYEDGSGGSVVIWAQNSTVTNYNIYAQYIKSVPSNGNGNGEAISFGDYYSIFLIIGIISVLIVKKRKMKKIFQ